MSYISGVGPQWSYSTFDRSLSFERVDYSDTSGHGGDEGGATFDIDAYEDGYLHLLLTRASIVITVPRSGDSNF